MKEGDVILIMLLPYLAFCRLRRLLAHLMQHIAHMTTTITTAIAPPIMPTLSETFTVDAIGSVVKRKK